MENNKMTSNDYLKDRLNKQINWYDKKSIRNKKAFRFLSMAEIIIASSIPFFVSYVTDDKPWVKFLVGGLGVVIAIITGAIALFKSQELWIEYRTTCELLRHHEFLFRTGTAPYDRPDAFHVLVENIENFISTEHSKWNRHIKEKKKKEEKMQEE